MNGFAGPLHGAAIREVMIWLKKLQQEVGDNVTEEQMKDFVWKTLKSGQRIPGYGHSTLRRTDSRYLCQREFALKHFPNDPLFRLVSTAYKVVPPILIELGKIKNPWPNLDAHSGVLLHHYNLKEMNFYPVVFGVSRSLGLLASMIWNRALGIPLERPSSYSISALKEMVGFK